VNHRRLGGDNMSGGRGEERKVKSKGLRRRNGYRWGKKKEGRGGGGLWGGGGRLMRALAESRKIMEEEGKKGGTGGRKGEKENDGNLMKELEMRGGRGGVGRGGSGMRFTN